MPDSNSSHSFDQERLQHLVKVWHESILGRDIARLNEIWDDSYLSVSPDGSLITKEQELASVVDPNLQFYSLDPRDIHIRVLGETAVAMGVTHAQGDYEDTDISGQYRFTTVFKRFGNEWRAIVSHGTQVTSQ